MTPLKITIVVLVASLAAGIAYSQENATPAATTTPAFPQTITFEGRLTRADYERMLEHDFDVPPGTRRIEIETVVTGAERETRVRYALRGPAGFRGFDRGAHSTVTLSALTAPPGFLPGAIEPGRWTVLLGVLNIRPQTEDTYKVVVRLFNDYELPARPVVLRSEPGWYAGDLHAHSGHSGDSLARSRSGKTIRTQPFQLFEHAAQTGLDFFVLSEHNPTSHWLDVDRLQPYYDSVLLLHGRELTTFRGHANTVGERAFLDPTIPRRGDHPLTGMLRPIASTGAFISINHPYADEPDTALGWEDVDDATVSSVHGVEVANGGKDSGWRFWAEMLNRGFRLTAVGGGDEHTPDESPVNVGVPTTVVYARELSEPAIVEGLKSGRVYVRVTGRDGPTMEFSAAAKGTTHPMGAVLPASSSGPIELQATIDRADGAVVEWVRNGIVEATMPVRPGLLTRSVTASPGDWFSLVICRESQPIAFSNAIMLARQ